MAVVRRILKCSAIGVGGFFALLVVIGVAVGDPESRDTPVTAVQEVQAAEITAATTDLQADAAAAPAAEEQAKAEAEAEKQAQEEADAKAKAEAEQKAAEEKQAAEERAEAEKQAREAAERKAAAEKKAQEEAAAAKAEAERKAAAEKKAREQTATVVHVVDGDTVDLSNGERVRVIGIDTPERGECGYTVATAHMESLVLGKQVTLVAGARDDRDRYDRILRYLDVGGSDAGLSQIENGYAKARYDSRDGYGVHPRERDYVEADAATADNFVCTGSPSSASGGSSSGSGASSGASGSTGTGSAGAVSGGGTGGASVYYKNCSAVRAAGAAPVRRGDPGYAKHLDRDGDGVGCE